MLAPTLARADSGPDTAFTARLLFGPALFDLSTEHGDDQRGPVLSTQLDLGVHLTELLGVHAVLLYDDSKWVEVDGLVDRDRAGGYGLGAGLDVRVFSLLASLALGWQSTQFTTIDDPASPSGAKAFFLLARVGYVWSIFHGFGLGGHLFGRYFHSPHDEGNGIRYDPRGYALGALLSFGFDGGKPLLP